MQLRSFVKPTTQIKCSLEKQMNFHFVDIFVFQVLIKNPIE